LAASKKKIYGEKKKRPSIKKGRDYLGGQTILNESLKKSEVKFGRANY